MDPGGRFNLKGIGRVRARDMSGERADGSSIAPLPKLVVQHKLLVGKRCVHAYAARPDCKDTIMPARNVIEGHFPGMHAPSQRWNSPSILLYSGSATRSLPEWLMAILYPTLPNMIKMENRDRDNA